MIVPANNLREEAPEGSVQTFQFADFTVRVVTIGGEPWFVAVDVALILGYRNSPDATRLLDEDEKGTQIVRTPGGAQELAIINESGLYSLILRSRKDEARPFRKWVTAEVLPAIRRTGTYTLTQPAALPSYPDALRQLADTLEAKAQAEAALELAAPKVKAFEQFMDSSTVYLVREAAKMLGLGQNRLYTFMRQAGIVIPGTCEPYQPHIDAGRFVVKSVPYMRGTEQATSKTTYVTTAGLEYLRRRLAEAGAAA